MSVDSTIEHRRNYEREYYHRNIERGREKRRESYYRTMQDPVRKQKYYEKRAQNAVNMRLAAYKSRAKTSGLAWQLTDDKAREFFLSPCTYCGLPATSLLPSGIDRKDSTRGYETDNIFPSCPQCNYAKSDYAFHVWEAWLDRIVNYAEARKQKIKNGCT